MAIFTVTTASDSVTPNDGATSLREAVQAANLISGQDTIAFNASLDGQTIDLTSVLDILESITIDASNVNLTIDGGGTTKLFNVAGNVSANFNGLTLVNGASGTSGGAIFGAAGSSITVEDSTLTSNSVSGSVSYGGAIAGDDVTISNSIVSGNSTSGMTGLGGGIYAEGTLDITSSTITGNSTSGQFGIGGGAFAVGDVTVTSTTISGNTTTGSGADGGGLFYSNKAYITTSTITGNVSGGNGGGIASDGNVDDPSDPDLIDFRSVSLDPESSVALAGNSSGSGQPNAGILGNPAPLGAFIEGTDFDDIINGLAGADFIDAHEGNDFITGGGGNDFIDACGGDDIVFGSDGADIIIAGSGTDDVNGGNGADSIDGGAQDDTLNGATGNDIILGGSGDDVIRGGAQNDILRGNGDNDTLFGQNGFDTLEGNNGDDVLQGGRGEDVLIGGSGNDILNGGAQSDRVTGGNGNDIFQFAFGDGADVFTDFDPGQGNFLEIIVLDLTGSGISSGDVPGWIAFRNTYISDNIDGDAVIDLEPGTNNPVHQLTLEGVSTSDLTFNDIYPHIIYDGDFGPA